MFGDKGSQNFQVFTRFEKSVESHFVGLIFEKTGILLVNQDLI